MFRCLLDLRSSKCYVVSLYFMCCSANGFVCVVCLTMFMNCLGNNSQYFGCGCECVECGWRSSVGYTVYGLLNNACVVPVIPSRCSFHRCVYVGSNLLI